jgi:hypothetical protein
MRTLETKILCALLFSTLCSELIEHYVLLVHVTSDKYPGILAPETTKQ